MGNFIDKKLVIGIGLKSAQPKRERLAASMKDINTVYDFRHQYLSHWDVNEYLDALQAKYPDLVQVKTIGYSFERRTLKSIHISNSMDKRKELEQIVARQSKSAPIRNTSKSVQRFSAIISNARQKSDSTSIQKPIILIDGGMHAREWCTISSALNIAHQLTDSFGTNKDLVDAFDFVIVPIVNADGYEYSRTFVRFG